MDKKISERLFFIFRRVGPLIEFILQLNFAKQIRVTVIQNIQHNLKELISHKPGQPDSRPNRFSDSKSRFH